jgi:hypothetical protein
MRSNLQSLFGKARRNVTVSPSTTTDIEPPSVSMTLVYARGSATGVVVVVVAGRVVVVVGAAVVVGRTVVVVVAGWVVEVVLGWVSGAWDVDDVVPAWGRDFPAPSDRAWVSGGGGASVVVVVRGSSGSSTTCSTTGWVVVVDAGVVVVSRVSSTSLMEALVATVIAGDADTPRAVGTSVTSLRTLPTAAAAMVTATTVAANHAIPIPPNLLILSSLVQNRR